jgi:hypothetical protein
LTPRIGEPLREVSLRGTPVAENGLVVLKLTILLP